MSRTMEERGRCDDCGKWQHVGDLRYFLGGDLNVCIKCAGKREKAGTPAEKPGNEMVKGGGG